MTSLLTIPTIDMSPLPKGKTQHIEVPVPKMGGKGWMLEEKGVFCLERGPGSLGTIACTHAGAGALAAYDGIPDDDGWLPDEDMARDHELYHFRNGRRLFFASPAAMGSWWLNVGFHHGLTIVAAGGHQGSITIASIVWNAARARQ